MSRHEQINAIHEDLNDVFLDLHNINICDEQGREARQHAVLSLINLRKRLESMGMGHTMPAGGNHARRP